MHVCFCCFHRLDGSGRNWAEAIYTQGDRCYQASRREEPGGSPASVEGAMPEMPRRTGSWDSQTIETVDPMIQQLAIFFAYNELQFKTLVGSCLSKSKAGFFKDTGSITWGK